MTNEKAIELLKIAVPQDESLDEEGLFLDAINMAIKALKGKDTNVPAKWIPVSERLPEMTGDYIVTGKTFIGNDNFPKDFYRATQIRKFYVKTGKWDTYFSDEVVAWMPLPEPWKGEKHE